LFRKCGILNVSQLYGLPRPVTIFFFCTASSKALFADSLMVQLECLVPSPLHKHYFPHIPKHQIHLLSFELSSTNVNNFRISCLDDAAHLLLHPVKEERSFMSVDSHYAGLETTIYWAN
jgi:hypothetical protein